MGLRKNYLRLRERYSHELDQKYEIVRDWAKYCHASYDLKVSKEARDIDRMNITLEEIENRYRILLGDKYIDTIDDN